MSKLDLLSHTNEITTIKCSLCPREVIIKDAAEQAIDELHSLGWRATSKKCKCPSCGSKSNFESKDLVFTRVDLEEKLQEA